MVNNISAVRLMRALGKDGQVSQYLAKCFPNHKDSSYMIPVEEVELFLNRQVISRLVYRVKAEELLKTKEYLQFTDFIDVKTTTKKANAVKKGTIKDLRKYLELKGLTQEFSEMLNNGELDEMPESEVVPVI